MGKEIRVSCTEEFYDVVEETTRRVGDVFEVSKERYDVLAGANYYQRAFVKEYVEEEQDLTKLSKSELQALLTDKGISFDKKDTKDDLITLLNDENVEK